MAKLDQSKMLPGDLSFLAYFLDFLNFPSAAMC